MQFLADFNDYEPWSGATYTAQRIRAEGKWDELESHLEEVFCDKTPTDGEINDYLWFGSDSIYRSLNMKPDDPSSKTAEEFAEEWCGDNGKYLVSGIINDGYIKITYRELDDNDEPTGDSDVKLMDEFDVRCFMSEENVEFDEENGTIEYW